MDAELIKLINAYDLIYDKILEVRGQAQDFDTKIKNFTYRSIVARIETNLRKASEDLLFG